MATPSQIARSIRLILGDYNYWPASESDSPLTVKTKKGLVDDKAALSLDASMRRKANIDTMGYVVPTNRTIVTQTLDEVLKPLVTAAGQEVAGLVAALETGPIASLEMPTEKLEFLTQLHGAYKALLNPRILKISTLSEPLVGFLIVGETPIDGVAPDPTVASIISQTLLVQT